MIPKTPKQKMELKLWRKRLKERNIQKKAGYTEEEIKKLETTLHSKQWRMSHLYKIRNKEGYLITFKPNKAQKEFISGAHSRNIILKSRQLGFTVLECIDILDEVLFNENFMALMIFHTKLAAEDKFRNVITLAWENIPKVLKARFTVDTDKSGEIRFKHGEGIYSTVACRTSGMSGVFSRAHISEFGILCHTEPAKAMEIVQGTFPAIPSSGRLDIESTARGNSGLFYDMYVTAMSKTDAERTASDFKPWFFNWTYDTEAIESIKRVNPNIPTQLRRYQAKHELSDKEITFYYNKMKETGMSFDLAWKFMKTEYPTTIEEAFEGSGTKLFDIDVINKAIRNINVIPEKVNQWTYFKNYKPNHRYGIGVDVAEGIGRDSSAITIMDFTNCSTDDDGNPIGKAEVVAHYENDKIAPDILAYEIRNGARLYGNPLVAVERNNHGHATLVILKSIYPENLLYKEIQKDRLTNVETEKLGWYTGGTNKPTMFYDIKTATDEDRIEIQSEQLLREMLSYDEGKLNQTKDKEHESKHWDLLTSAAICYQMRDYAKVSQRKKKKVDESFDKWDII